MHGHILQGIDQCPTTLDIIRIQILSQKEVTLLYSP